MGLGDRERCPRLVVPKPLWPGRSGPPADLELWWYCLSAPPVGDGDRAGLVDADHDPLGYLLCEWAF